MKCPYCNNGVSYYSAPNYRYPCTVCDGSGEIKPTNQEYIQNCSSEELAEIVYSLVWLGNEVFTRLECSGDDNKESDLKIVREWLQEVRNDERGD